MTEETKLDEPLQEEATKSTAPAQMDESDLSVVQSINALLMDLLGRHTAAGKPPNVIETVALNVVANSLAFVFHRLSPGTGGVFQILANVTQAAFSVIDSHNATIAAKSSEAANKEA